jgi:hypothetical protein
LGLSFVCVRLIGCTETASEARNDAGTGASAASDRDGLPCTQASDCREGAACVHGICLGPACKCNTSDTEIFGFPTGTTTSCKGDCKAGYGCGVASFLTSSDDLDFKGADVFRCIPSCEPDGGAPCPDGFSCTPRGTCGTAGARAHIEVATEPAPVETTVTLHLVIDKAYAPIHTTRWTVNNADGTANGNDYTFTPQAGSGGKYQATVYILDEQGGQANLEKFVNVCLGENHVCQLGSTDACCPGLHCVDTGDAGGFLTCVP